MNSVGARHSSDWFLPNSFFSPTDDIINDINDSINDINNIIDDINDINDTEKLCHKPCGLVVNFGNPPQIQNNLLLQAASKLNVSEQQGKFVWQLLLYLILL